MTTVLLGLMQSWPILDVNHWRILCLCIVCQEIVDPVEKFDLKLSIGVKNVHQCLVRTKNKHLCFLIDMSHQVIHKTVELR